MTSFLTQSEMASDSYLKLAGAGSLRSFITVAASILGDLCDEVAQPIGLDGERFPTYMGFCEWVRDFPAPETSSGFWLYYWDIAADVFDLYDCLPELNDWELYEEVVLFRDSDQEPSDCDMESLIRNRIIESCFALSRWIRGAIIKKNTPPFSKAKH